MVNEMNFNLRGSFRFLTKLPLAFQSTSPLKSPMGCFISGNAHVGVYSKYQRQSSMTVIVKQISSRSICLVHGISISSRVFSKIYFVLHCSFRLIFDRNVNTKLFEYFAGNAPTKIS